MGARIAFTRAVAVHDSHCRPVSLEFSLAAILPSHPGDLRRGSAAPGLAVNGCRYYCACRRRSDGNRSVYLPDGWFLHSSAYMDLSWAGCGLGLLGISVTQFSISPMGPRRDHFLCVT